MRLDSYLSEKGLAKSRSYAKTLIDEGYVTVNGDRAQKPSLDITDSDVVEVVGEPYSFVSRGGVKLDAAISAFEIDVKGMTCVDIGASSGGFTDCLLKRGACRVYAVDSGRDQLDASLVSDERVVNIEGFNARNMTVEDLGEPCDIAVTDVSFISQTLIIPAAFTVLKDDGIYISLVKPQFECGRQGLGKGGIVKSKAVIVDAVEKVISSAEYHGLGCVGLIKSPICGGDGNREFLILCRKGTARNISLQKIKEICL